MTCDLREPRTPRRMFENINWAGIQLGLQADACNRGAAVEADAIGEQQQKRMRACSSGRNRGAAAGSGRKQGAAQQLKQMQLGQGAAEADASGEQQLKRMQSDAIGLKRTQSGSSSSAQRAVGRRITHGRQTKGSS